MQLFIDGENLRHRLVSVLFQERLLDDRDDMYDVDVRKLVTEALGEEPEAIHYYTTNIQQPDFDIPDLLSHKIKIIHEAHANWVGMLESQHIDVVRAGNLKVKQSNRCYHCGRRTMVLQEKGVDVRLASDVVMAAVHDNVQDIVVLSSDADMIPALTIAHKGGARLTYLCFGEEINHALEAATDAMIVYTREQIKQAFRGRIASQHPLVPWPEPGHDHKNQQGHEQDHGHGQEHGHGHDYENIQDRHHGGN